MLAAAPQAATIEMGTFLLGPGSVAAGDDEVRAAVVAAQDQVGGMLPIPTFAGFGWTPGAGLDGTADLRHDLRVGGRVPGTAGAVLTDSWLRGSTDLRRAAGGGRTLVTGAVVATEVSDVPPDEFDLRTLRLADYRRVGDRLSRPPWQPERSGTARCPGSR